MEGIITLIIIIIVFNIISFLGRALRGGRQVERQKVPVDADRFAPKELLHPRKDEDTYFRSVSFQDPETDRDTRVSPDITTSETVKEPGKETAKQKPQRPEQLIAPGAGKPSSITVNLQQALSQKEPLVASFIFHEIIDPPLALRRKR